MYRERASSLRGAVLWVSDGPDPAPDAAVPAVLPDGCLDLLWIDGELVIAGPDTGPQPTGGVPRSVTGLRFGSGLGPGLLGVPADEVVDRRVPLTELWPTGRVAQWRDRVARDPARFERTVLAGLDDLGERHRGVRDEPMLAVARMCAGGLTTGEIVGLTGWSDRTLHRRARAAFGYGTKTLTRILRFQRALPALRVGDSAAAVAAAAGYADQAHLTREVRALAGTTPTALRTRSR